MDNEWDAGARANDSADATVAAADATNTDPATAAAAAVAVHAHAYNALAFLGFDAVSASASASGASAALPPSQQSPALFASDLLALMSPYLNLGLPVGSFPEDPENILLSPPFFSPAITPSLDFAAMSLHPAFSPLSSPALHPSESSASVGSSTTPGVKRTPRRTSTAGPSTSAAKKKTPKSPYVNPNPRNSSQSQAPSSSSSVDALRISSPMLSPFARAATSDGKANQGSSSPASTETVDAQGFKMPALPASRVKRRSTSAKTGGDSSVVTTFGTKPNSSSAPVDAESKTGFSAMTPGQLLDIASEDDANNEDISQEMDVEDSGEDRKRKSGTKVLNDSPTPEGSDEPSFMEVEAKKEHHKMSEQKRRDSMKQCFDDLRKVLPQFSDKNPSKEKVLILARNYILSLEKKLSDADRAALESKRRERELQQEIERMKRG
ncbi:hypothetical protein HDU83_007508 [Entophlyctis luteolus]|nr:hypothetical protein HDU83_007508 [Entophlyctis luteolus]KAJ3376930.1 hypothetical protein HDU84_009223 [Entophlyctis sp. JEL0112]